MGDDVLSTDYPSLENGTRENVTYSSSDNDVVKANGSGYRIVGPGFAVVTATAGDYQAACNFVITDATAAGTYNSSTNTYEFTEAGVLASATITDVDGVTLTLGNGTNKVLVVDRNGTLGAKVMDDAGYFAAYPNAQSDGDSHAQPYMGTYYQFTTGDEMGTLTINTATWMQKPRLYCTTDNSDVDFEDSGNNRLQFKANPYKTYLLYIDNWDTDNPLYLHSFSFEAITPDITVGESQHWFRKTVNGDDGTFTYTSSDPTVLAIEEDSSLGIVTIKGTGYAEITASKGGVKRGSYLVKVKKDNWDFTDMPTDKSLNTGSDGWTIWSDVSQTSPILFDGKFRTGERDSKRSIRLYNENRKEQMIKIPAIANQYLYFEATMSNDGKNGANFWLATTNLTDLKSSGNNTTNGTNFRIAEKDYNSYHTGKVKEGASYATLGLTQNGMNDDHNFFTNFRTFFPQPTLSFANSQFEMSFKQDATKAGQEVTTNKPAGLYYKIESDAEREIATVDPWTGDITMHKESASVQTVTVTAYALGIIGETNGRYEEATGATTEDGDYKAAKYTLRILPVISIESGKTFTYDGTVKTNQRIYVTALTEDGESATALLQVNETNVKTAEGNGVLTFGQDVTTMVAKATSTGTLTITNTSTNEATLILNLVEVTNNEGLLDLDYTKAKTTDGVVFFEEEETIGSQTVYDEFGDEVTSYYNAPTYSIVSGGASVDSGTGTVTIGSTQEIVEVIATRTSKSDVFDNIEGIYRFYVTDGEWNINGEYPSSETLNGAWKTNGSYRKDKAPIQTEFDFIYNNANSLYDVTYGLQLAGSATFYSNNKELVLFSANLNNTQKGSIRIPARAGMIVNIKATGSDEMADFDISNVMDTNGKTVSKLETDKSKDGMSFICIKDGFVTLENKNAALSIAIQYIMASDDIMLKDGEEVFVKPATLYTPAVTNEANNTFEYTFYTDYGQGTTPANYTLNDDFDTTGKLTLNQTGEYKVKVTGLTGPLKDKTKDIIIYAVNMGVKTTPVSASLNNTTREVEGTYQNNLAENITLSFTGSSDEKITEIKKKIVFTMHNCTDPGTDATVTKSGEKYVFASDGVGDVTIKAVLGTIEATFVYQVSGVQFANTHPIIPNTAESYKLELNPAHGTLNSVDGSSITVKVYGNLADIRASSVTLNGDNTITIANIEERTGFAGHDDAYCKSSKGGAIEVSANVNFTPDDGSAGDRTIKTLITVAYSQHIWNFQTDPIEGDDNQATLRSGDLANRPVPANKDVVYVAENNTWSYERKFHSPKSEAGYVYRYKPALNGQNASIIHESAGMQIFSEGALATASKATYTDNDFVKTEDPENHVITNTLVGNDGDPYYESGSAKYSTKDTQSELLFKNGCRIVIPGVKPGQQIDCYWHRHDDDHGERLTMKNLSDASGAPIDEIYKICFTGEGHKVKASDGSGCYSFIVSGTGNTPIDVEISSADGNWTRIHEIVLWNLPNSIYDDTQSTYYSRQEDFSKYDYLHLDDGTSFDIPLNDAMWKMNVHNGGTPTYTYKLDDTLKGTVTWSKVTADNPEPDDMGYPTFHFTGGWGKLYVTLANCTQDTKYISTWRNYTITVGKKPQQTYPYTWDFTKYFAKTKSEIVKNDKNAEYIVVKVRDDKAKTVTRATQTWAVNENDYKLQTEKYGTSLYESYHVDGAQLVSQALAAPLSETEGLGFDLSCTSTGGKNLQLAMTDGVEADGEGATGGKTWRSGKLSIGAGGKVIVPKPGANYDDYYIYIRSSKAPTDYTNVKKMVSSTPDNAATEEQDNSYDVSTNQYKYHFTTDANVEFTFGEGADIEVIAVTDLFKDMTPIGGTAWATEARGRTIDHTLTGHLTVNPVEAYAVIARVSGSNINPKFAEDKSKTTVSISDQRYVVPAKTGLVLKQTKRYDASSSKDDKLEPLAAGATAYKVPFFVPAVTTAEDAASSFTNNLMRCAENPDEEYKFDSETEEIQKQTSAAEGEAYFSDNIINEYGGTEFTRFILAKRYMTWTQTQTETEDGTKKLTTPTEFETKEAAVFYRLHVYGSDEYGQLTGLGDEDGTLAKLNTLGANKAYLLLPNDKINPALWGSSPGSSLPAPAYDYVGILGVSDMEEAEQLTDGPRTDGHIYNLRGQLVGDDASRLPAGVYIRNGRKIVVR